MKKIDRELLHATIQGDIEKVKSLLNNGANPNAHGRDFETPIMEAIEYYHNEIVSTLIQMGASLECQDIMGRTPHEIAVKSGNTQAIRILMQNHAVA